MHETVTNNLTRSGCKWVVEIEIADVWIDDGFSLATDLLADAIDEKLLGGYTGAGEIKVTLISGPTASQIREATNRLAREQGKDQQCAVTT